MAIEARLIGNLAGVRPETRQVTVGTGWSRVEGPFVVGGLTLIAAAIEGEGPHTGVSTVIADAADIGQADLGYQGSAVVDGGSWWVHVSSGSGGTYSISTVSISM